MTVRYLDLDDVVAAGAAAVTPAELLIRDWGLLESAIARPRASAFGQDAYPDVWPKAAALLESLSRNHPLIDGNKRLAWVSTRFFLAINDLDLIAVDAQDGDKFVRSVAQGVLELADVAAQLRSWRR
ncbi:MAG TPA: Fic family protein [Jatrophihabitans sp.]